MSAILLDFPPGPPRSSVIVPRTEAMNRQHRRAIAKVEKRDAAAARRINAKAEMANRPPTNEKSALAGAQFTQHTAKNFNDTTSVTPAAIASVTPEQLAIADRYVSAGAPAGDPRKATT